MDKPIGSFPIREDTSVIGGDGINNVKFIPKSKIKPYRIGLLGGAFDPPTQGHIELAQLIINRGIVDHVDLLPCYKSLHDKQMTDSRLRLTMCRMATERQADISVENYEMKHKFSGSTHEFVNQFFEENHYRIHEYKFIIGMDNAKNFSKWVNPEFLKDTLSFIVVARPGVNYTPTEDDWFMKEPHVFVDDKEGVLPNISSTMVRDMFKQHRNAQWWSQMFDIMDYNIIQLIEDWKLYR